MAVLLLCGLMLLPAPDTTLAADAVMTEDRKQLADGLFSRSLYQLALKEYEHLAGLKPPPPGSDETLFRLGECQRHLGNPAAAEASFRRLAAEHPDSPRRQRAIFLRAMMIIEMGNPAIATELLESLLASDDLPAELAVATRLQAGQAAEAAGSFEKARHHYQALRQTAADDPQADFAGLHLAQLHAREGTPEALNAAMALYTTLAARKQAPRIAAEALFHGGALAYAKEDFATSARLYQQLAETYPDDFRTAESALPAAWAALRIGRGSDTIKRATKALADTELTTAKRAEWLYLQANACRQLKQDSEAVALYDALLATDASSAYAAAARREQLVSLYRSGAFERFLRDGDALTTPPGDFKAELLWMQANAAESLKDTTRAIQYYRLITEETPDSQHVPYATYRLADQLQRQQAWHEASRHYLHLADKWPTNQLVPRALLASGICLVQAGQPAAALRDWHQLHTRFPDHETIPSALFQKAQVEVGMERNNDAAATLDQIINQHPKYELIDEARFWRARLAYDAGDLKLTEELLRTALKGTPATNIRHESSFLLGLVLHATGREAEAAAVLQPLIGDSIAMRLPLDRLKWLSEYQYSRQAWSEAEFAASEMLKRAPAADWRQVAATLLGRAALAGGKTNEAINAYQTALAADAHTSSAAEAALRLGELHLASGDTAAASERLRQAAAAATTPELQSIRALAYSALGTVAETEQRSDDAIRYYMSVALLYHDVAIVPHALDRAATILAAAGRHDESHTTANELITRYPETPQAKKWQAKPPQTTANSATEGN